MAVGFDAQIYFVGTVGNSFTTSALTVGAGSNRALAVSLTFGDAAPPPGAVSLTWNSVALTLVASTLIVDTTNSYVSSIYALLNPASGNFALAGSYTGGPFIPVIGAVSFTGVDQTSVAVAFPHGNTATGTSATATVAITSATGNATIASFGSAAAGPFTSTSGTNIYLDGVSITPYCAASRDVGAASVSMTAPLTSSGTWAASGCDILASASALTLNVQQRIMM